METLSNLVSPKQVARAIGVSESSLKRWCDQGLIKTIKTVGGHRKMQVSDVLRFVRERDQELVSPEILELPPTTQGAELGLVRARPLLVEALLSGNEEVARQVVFDLYLARHPLCVICDEVIAGAFRDIGHRWACNEADTYQERRGCEIALRILFDLRRRQNLPMKSPLAIGGTIEGDVYALPSTMAELVLREAGWNATSLGNVAPIFIAVSGRERDKAKALLAKRLIHSAIDRFHQRIQPVQPSLPRSRVGTSRRWSGHHRVDAATDERC